MHFIVHTPEGGELVPCSALSLEVVLSRGPGALPNLQVSNLEKIKITALVGRGSRFRSTLRHIWSADEARLLFYRFQVIDEKADD